MGALTSAVHWWEESQLRILVLTSMAVQFFLLIFASLRRFTINRWVGSLTWLAYLAGDAVAIYALATLFNRHNVSDQGGAGGGRISSKLEVLWAPVLLIHLGGHDGITAYNIEDNELWSRHLLTAVSQVTVAIYVFCKSWPPGGDDKRLLLAGILLFVPGVLKCFHKPWALKSASIYSLVNLPSGAKPKDEMSLEEYLKGAKDYFVHLDRRRRTRNEHGMLADPEGIFAASVDADGDQHSHSQSLRRRLCAPLTRFIKVRQEIAKPFIVLGEASSKLFVDLSSPYPLRLDILKFFWGISEAKAYVYVQGGLNTAFLLLYTKLKTGGMVTQLGDLPAAGDLKASDVVSGCCRTLILLACAVLPWASIGLFHQSITATTHRSSNEKEAHHDMDVKITYAIFCCTAVLEVCSYYPVMVAAFESWSVVHPSPIAGTRVWPEMIAQYSLIEYFGSYKKHSRWMSVVSWLPCKDSVDQMMLCLEPCFSSAVISRLVLRYLKDDGWGKEINDAPSYRRFNDHNRHWPVFLHHREERNCSSSSNGHRLRLRSRPFDESVLLWHIATDFCFFYGSSFAKHVCGFAVRKCARGNNSPPCREESTDCKAVLCRQMSNYMAYLLFVNPEMLLPGSRRNLFTTAYEELVAMFKGEKPPLEKGELTRKIIGKLVESPSSSSQAGSAESFIHEAWMLALALQSLGDEKKMWEVIQGVWVEMLCFSASRCRGYLHAKALGSGGEFLSYVWLLLFYMGMETFTDKLQSEDLPSHEASGNNAATVPPLTPEVSSTTAAASASEVDTNAAGASVAPSTSEICMAQDDMV